MDLRRLYRTGGTTNGEPLGPSAVVASTTSIVIIGIVIAIIVLFAVVVDVSCYYANKKGNDSGNCVVTRDALAAFALDIVYDGQRSLQTAR